MNYILKIVLLLSLFACDSKSEDKTTDTISLDSLGKNLNDVNEKEVNTKPSLLQDKSYEERVAIIEKNIIKGSVLSNDQDFITKEILRKKFKINLNNYINKECNPIIVNKQELITDFEGFQNIEDIDNDKKDDFVFVLDPLDYCE